MRNTNQLTTLLNIKELKAEIESKLNDISKDYLNDNSGEDFPDYLSDSFTEYADNAVSVYTADQVNYYNEHQSACDNAAAELCILDSFDPRKDSIGDLVARAGAAGLFLDNEQQLNEDAENIRYYMALTRAEELGFNTLSSESWEYLKECADEAEDTPSELNDIHKIIIASESSNGSVIVAALKRADIRDFCKSNNIGRIFYITDATTREKYFTIDALEANI